MALALSLEIEPSPRLASVDALVLAFAWRPRIRAHCAGVPRPCRFISCAMNTYVAAVTHSGELVFTRPGLEPDEVPAESSCVLDLATSYPVRNPDHVHVDDARVHMGWPEIAAALNVSPQRAQQIGSGAIAKLRRLPVLREL